MKKIKKLFIGVIVGLSLLSSQQASAQDFRSHHYHRIVEPRIYEPGYYGPRYVEHIYVPHAVYGPGYYRPYYRPVITRYNCGYYGRCYEPFIPGISWNVNVGTGGWGFGVHTGW
jgi:hypothetical protein